MSWIPEDADVIVIACEGCIVYGPTIRGEKFRIESSFGHLVCWERNEDNGYYFYPHGHVYFY